MDTRMVCQCDRCEATFRSSNKNKQVSIPAIGESFTLCPECWLGLMHFMLNEPEAPSSVPVEHP